MSRSSRKPRPKLDPKKFTPGAEGEKKKEKERDWTFEDIIRSKTRHR